MNEEAKLAAVFPTLTESSLPIEELDLNVTARNFLLRDGIHTVAQLLQRTHTDLVGLFRSRGLPFYSEVIYQLTRLTEPPKAAKADGTCTVECLPEGILEESTRKRFNIFQVAGIWKSEEIHTRIIAELLNPGSTFHNMGAAFLKRFVTEVLQLPDLQEELPSAAVKTEVPTKNGRRIDMVIETAHNYLPFEVKIWAGDQESQLYDYYQYAQKKQGKTVPCIYYLTPDGHEPSDWSVKSSTGGSSLDRGKVQTLSFHNNILPWLEGCIRLADDSHHYDVLEIMKQLRDNIQGSPFCPQRHPGFLFLKTDILDEIYQVLCNRNYDLLWTECTDQYMTFTLHKKGSLGFALRMKKKSETCVSLHLICGVIQENKTPDYAKAGPYIYDSPDEFETLLSEAFSDSDREKVKHTTWKSDWERMKVILCERPHGSSLAAWASACSDEIEEVFSWLNTDVYERLKKKS